MIGLYSHHAPVNPVPDVFGSVILGHSVPHEGIEFAHLPERTDAQALMLIPKGADIDAEKFYLLSGERFVAGVVVRSVLCHSFAPFFSHSLIIPSASSGIRATPAIPPKRRSHEAIRLFSSSGFLAIPAIQPIRIAWARNISW